MSVELLRFLSDTAYARTVFFRTQRAPAEIRSFLANEATMLRIAQSNSTTSLTTLLLAGSSVPSFFDPVIIGLSSQQIEHATCPVEIAETSQDICCICQESLHSSPSCQIRQCNHKLHRACATQWFTMSVRCPVCRADLREHNQMNNNGTT